MDSRELKLEILRIVVESGSENQKWVSKADESSPKKNKTIRKTSSANLIDKKE